MAKKFYFRRLTEFFGTKPSNKDVSQFNIPDFFICCPYCKSKDFICKEIRRNKRKGPVRRYLCKNKNCRRKFSVALPGHLPLNVIEDILHLTVKGMTPTDVADAIGKVHGPIFRISPQIVMNTIKWVVRICTNFESSKRHEILSQEWQIDDTPQIFPISKKFANGKKVKFVWITNVMASSTRYWLSAIVSDDRTATESFKAVKLAINRAGYAPVMMKCDAYKGHIKGIRKAYPFVDIDYRSKKEDFGHINLIESLHSFIRRRGIKKRGRFRSVENLQCYVELIRLYYNFIHCNKTLGTTPAARVGLAPPFNNWTQFIRYSYLHSR